MADKVLALAGGVGGAKLALGLARILEPDELIIAVNTGDDDCFHGLNVSPDLDTVMYTLAGLANPETGWGLAGDTFQALEMLRRYGANTWFNLGDRDLATHIRRTQLLREGANLSQATAQLCRSLGVRHQVVPMSDDPVSTVLTTSLGELPMQQYFVQHKSEPKVTAVHYRGAEQALPAPALAQALSDADVVVLCPSNPILSLGPMLAIPGIRQGLLNAAGHTVVVSPLVGGAALRGPAAKLMGELGHQISSLGVARMYLGLCDIFVIDHQDAALAAEIDALGMRAVAESIIMNTEDDKIALARRVLDLGGW
ncbi:MAG: 2-phospho-L-lactate transferase [Dehalococcoidia bacterium]|nr:2-phospho-L-lactate transferase [Dehalococcoidia bacterium]MSQ17212.1 2-phospho-L-lactate transferase [Dehalococcoidia bacterium]